MRADSSSSITSFPPNRTQTETACLLKQHHCTTPAEFGLSFPRQNLHPPRQSRQQLQVGGSQPHVDGKVRVGGRRHILWNDRLDCALQRLVAKGVQGDGRPLADVDVGDVLLVQVLGDE